MALTAAATLSAQPPQLTVRGTMQLTARCAMEEPRRRVSTGTRRQEEAEIFFRRSRMVFPAIAAAAATAATARATRKAAAERRQVIRITLTLTLRESSLVILLIFVN